MPRLLFFAAIAAAALVFCASATAQVYKWKDANGTTHYSDAPPPAGARYEKVNVSSSVSTPITPAPAASAAASNKTSAPTQTETRMNDTPDNRAKLCKQLDDNIALLSSGQEVTSGDTHQNMSDTQRQQELATAQAQKKQYCSS